MSPKQGFFQTPTPVLLSSPCVVSQRNIGVPQSAQLSYPFRRAIWIEEIRIDLSYAAAANLALGTVVYAKFQLGKHYLMRDPVPVQLLGTLMNTEQEAGNDSGGSGSFSHYRWRLPEPLYVEAGQYLQTELYRYADGFGDINAQVSYVGRTVAQDAPRPKTLAVPYVAPFVTRLNPPGAFAQSNEYNLFNPFDVPIRIQRLTGRYTLFVPGSTLGYDFDVTPAQGFAVGSQTTVRIYDSFGGKVVNDYTGVSDVFDIARAAWTVDTDLPAKSMYQVQVWHLETNYQVAIAMVGVREEAL